MSVSTVLFSGVVRVTALGLFATNNEGGRMVRLWVVFDGLLLSADVASDSTTIVDPAYHRPGRFWIVHV